MALDLTPVDREVELRFQELRSVINQLRTLGPARPLGNALLQELVNTLAGVSRSIGVLRTSNLRLEVDRADILAAVTAAETALGSGPVKDALETARQTVDVAERADVPDRRGPRP